MANLYLSCQWNGAELKCHIRLRNSEFLSIFLSHPKWMGALKDVAMWQNKNIRTKIIDFVSSSLGSAFSISFSFCHSDESLAVFFRWFIKFIVLFLAYSNAKVACLIGVHSKNVLCFLLSSSESLSYVRSNSRSVLTTLDRWFASWANDRLNRESTNEKKPAQFDEIDAIDSATKVCKDRWYATYGK